jgi:hypothetical protein
MDGHSSRGLVTLLRSEVASPRSRVTSIRGEVPQDRSMEDLVDLGVTTGGDAVPLVRNRVALVGGTITTIRRAVPLLRQAVALVSGTLPLPQVALAILARHSQPPSMHGLCPCCLQEQVAMGTPAMRSARLGPPLIGPAPGEPVAA